MSPRRTAPEVVILCARQVPADRKLESRTTSNLSRRSQVCLLMMIRAAALQVIDNLKKGGADANSWKSQKDAPDRLKSRWEPPERRNGEGKKESAVLVITERSVAIGVIGPWAVRRTQPVLVQLNCGHDQAVTLPMGLDIGHLGVGPDDQLDAVAPLILAERSPEVAVIVVTVACIGVELGALPVAGAHDVKGSEVGHDRRPDMGAVVLVVGAVGIHADHDVVVALLVVEERAVDDQAVAGDLGAPGDFGGGGGGVERLEGDRDWLPAPWGLLEEGLPAWDLGHVFAILVIIRPVRICR